MAKYHSDFKLKIVQEYLDGIGSYKFLCNKYDIPSTTPLKRWVAAYKSLGTEGLIRSRKKQTYTLDFKLHVVELYLTTEVSYQNLALLVGVNNPSIIAKWINDYRIAGPDALKPKRRGRAAEMNRINANGTGKKTAASADADELKKLQEENLKLRIENAYLKELRRLRLEGIPQNKKRD